MNRPILWLIGFAVGYFMCGLLAYTRYSPCYNLATLWREADATADVILAQMAGKAPHDDDSIEAVMRLGAWQYKQEGAYAAACLGTQASEEE